MIFRTFLSVIASEPHILETILFIETDNIQGMHFNFRTICIMYIYYRASLA